MKDKLKARAYARGYYAANRDRERSRSRAYSLANPEKKLARNRAYYAANLEKARSYARAYSLANPKRRRNAVLRAKYGINVLDYQILFDSQNGLCAVCGEIPNGSKLEIDHNHETGKVRGLLCHLCNTSANRHMTPELLRQLAVYIENSAQSIK